MKRIVSVILALLIVCSLAACEISSGDTAPNTSEKETIQNATVSTTPSATVPETTPTEATVPATTEGSKDNETNNSIGAKFKAAMDSYEDFFDKYVAIMKKYKKNPTDMSILADYANYMGQYADMMQKFEQWENEDLNTAELAYYIEVQAKITKKLLEVAQD